MLRRIMAVCVCVAAIALVAIGALFTKGAHAGAVATESTSSTTVPANPSLAQVRTMALTEAARGGDAAPIAIEETSGTLGQVVAVTDGEHKAPSAAVIDPETGAPWVDSPVDVVTMHGDFTLNSAPVPVDEPQPQGTILTVIIDKQSGTVEGRELSDSVPNLAAINSTVTNLTE